MTFDEIREMVNATITENGQRQITGKALNLALLEIITAMEENKPEGGGVETVYLFDDPDTMELTPEHQAANAAVYAKCEAALAEGKPLPGMQADTTNVLASNYGTAEGFKAMSTQVISMFVSQDSPIAEYGDYGLMVMFFIGDPNDTWACLIAADGTVNSIR